MLPADRRLRRTHDAFLGGDGAGTARDLVADSWQRSLAASLDADRISAPMVMQPDELADYRTTHPLSAVFPLLYDVLGRAAEDCDSVMAVGDNEGRLLWVCGRPAVIAQAENIRFVEGTQWDEQHVGTNAPGTALRLDMAVQIRSAEHFAVHVQPWSCAAAPIHDPETQRILGVVDVTGGADAASPQSLSMVRSAARMAEAELGRLLVVRRSGEEAHRQQVADGAIRVDGLGRPDCEVYVGGRIVRLSQRHSEILVALADLPSGLTGDQLALEIYGEDVHSSTLRAEIVRLRALLGADLLQSRPYRLTAEMACDWLAVQSELEAGRVRSALRSYRGPLLPQSDAPGVVTRREQLERRLRFAVLASDDPDLLVAWTRSRWGLDDLEAWERQVEILPPSSPLSAMSRGEVLRLRAEYGIDALTTRTRS